MWFWVRLDFELLCVEAFFGPLVQKPDVTKLSELMNIGSVNISPQMFTSLSASFNGIPANLVILLAIKFIEY